MNKSNLVRNLLISISFIFFGSLLYGQDIDSVQPTTKTEPFIHIVSVKDGVVNAVILCKASGNLCLFDKDLPISKIEFVRSRGYDIIKEIRPLTLSGETYYSLIVSK